VTFVVTTTLETINRQETVVLYCASNLGTARNLEGNIESKSAIIFTPGSYHIFSWQYPGSQTT